MWGNIIGNQCKSSINVPFSTGSYNKLREDTSTLPGPKFPPTSQLRFGVGVGRRRGRSQQRSNTWRISDRMKSGGSNLAMNTSEYVRQW